MLLIGLTGSIAMGKSTTAAAFASHGLPVFDADRAVHELYRGRAAPLVDAAFPGTVGPEGVDRTKLSQKLVGDPGALRRLEAIVHPLVAEEERAFMQAATIKGSRIAVFDTPLLFETGGEKRMDVVGVVSAPAAVQRERLLSRGLDDVRVEALLARQMSDAEKRRRAHFLIDSSGGFEASRRMVADVVRALRPLAEVR